MQELLKRSCGGQLQSPPCPSPSKSSTKKSSSKSSRSNATDKTTVLTKAQWDSFEQKYQAMVPERKWLIDGIYVEDVIYKFAKTQLYEHAAHSFILDLGDPCWKTVFTTSQLQAIEQQNALPVPALPEHLNDFFSRFKELTDINEIHHVADHAHFDVVSQFDADWAKRCILDTVSAYRWSVMARLASRGKERDMLRLWRAIDDCFDDLGVEVQRSDQQSAASSARHNEESCAADGSIKQKVHGVKPDLIIARNMLEFASAEHDYLNEAGVGAKELVEKLVKLPKNMKDMMLSLAAEMGNDEAGIRSLRIVGFSHTHLRVNTSVMDVPAGYTCRIKHFEEIRIPCELRNFYNTYIKFLKQVYRLKHIIKATIEAVENSPAGTDDEEEGFVSVLAKKQRKLIIPSALNYIEPPTVVPQKRNREDDEQDSSNNN
ncbi:hypothetical protein BDB00DRAFT_836427 [Zychaea mexicana]|uniref:uncharacterized protein n=1 Tax=Zychaea mexicana TaxID=64656 RepID=UPI0022FE7AE4|nr:uncharacterized protein BDB00DRAFT_836427 [Zychaea mexicana]KAI9490707.1 hypothetical protein BDB00DRAFT_836427 [Zychaea mexicana]